MDILILFLLNTLLFALAFIFLARRFHRLYNTQAFLMDIDREVKTIMTAFNQSADENIRILEDRIGALQKAKVEAETVIQKYAELRGDAVVSIPLSNQRVFPSLPPVQNVESIANEQKLETVIKVGVSTAIADDFSEATVANSASIKDQVIAYARMGLEAQLISQRLGVPFGEVQLIVRLNSGY
jgi:hypothetical protein